MSPPDDEQLRLYFTRVVRGTTATTEDLPFVSRRTLSWRGEPGQSDAVFKLGGRRAVRLTAAAVEAGRLAAEVLRSRLDLEHQAQRRDIDLEVYEAAAKLRLGRANDLDQVLEDLLDELAERVGRSLIVVGVAGLVMPSVIRLGSSILVGHLSAECEEELRTQRSGPAGCGTRFPHLLSHRRVVG